MEIDVKLLKEVLSVQTYTGQEERMIDFLEQYLIKKKYSFFKDDKNNIYVTKGIVDFYYPCVVAHMDTVHRIVSDNYKINSGSRMQKTDSTEIEKEAYFATEFDNPTGCGGDNKSGVFLCISILEAFENIKVAFFVSEENGCKGSEHADKIFFSNVGYTIQFDAPENWMVTQYCMNVKLFEKDSNFGNIVVPILNKHFGKKLRFFSHPFTDVWKLKNHFNFSCINISSGYYMMHSKNEYVILEDVDVAYNLTKEMIQKLGEKMYELPLIIQENKVWDQNENPW